MKLAAGTGLITARSTVSPDLIAVRTSTVPIAKSPPRRPSMNDAPIDRTDKLLRVIRTGRA